MKLTPFQKAILRRIKAAGEIPYDNPPYGKQVLSMLFGRTYLMLCGKRLPSGEFYYTWEIFPGRFVREAIKDNHS